MSSRLLYCLVLCVSFVQFAFAQPGEVEVKEREGKKFYVHVVQQGNTLWGLYNTYKVPVESIIRENPGVESGLSIGQIVWIPVPGEETTAAPVQKTERRTIHKVEQGETLYGISRKYGISVDVLMAKNPGVENGLSIGQELIIEGSTDEQAENSTTQEQVEDQVREQQPVTRVIFEDSLVEHTVLKHETLYSISKRFMVSMDTLVKVNKIKNNKIRTGDVLVIPLKKETITGVVVREVPEADDDVIADSVLLFPRKDQFRVAVLLPMNYDLNGGVYGVSVGASMNKYTSVAVEFYMGIKLALDSLANLGLNAEVSLFDTKSDSLTTSKLLGKMEGSDWDLVIGPLMPGPSKAVANWAKKNKVPILAPVPIPVSNLKSNRFVFASVPSDTRLLEGMADELIKNHAKHNIILVKSGLKADEKNYEIVRKRLNDQLGTGAFRPVLKEINLGSTSGRDIATHIQKDMVNIFVVPSESRVFAANFMTTMNKVRNISRTYDEADIRVYGLRDWDGYDEVKLDYKRRLNLHYPSAVSVNYEEQQVQDFIKIFRDVYKTDPDKYAMQGFDVTMQFVLKYLLKSKKPIEGVINNIHYSTRGVQNGFENNNVFIVRYNNFVIEEAGRVY